jgi:hypothetical protein
VAGMMTTKRASRNDSVSDFPPTACSPDQSASSEDVYKETSMPVVEYYSKQGKVAEIDSSPSVDEVYEEGAKVVRKLLAGQFSGTVAS